jgi:hypothetical protein
MINAIVIAASAIAVLFVAVWFFFRNVRTWIEAPKYTMLARDRQFGRAISSTASPNR